MISTAGKIVKAVGTTLWTEMRKPKRYPLPKCPLCRSSEWVTGQRYIYERWSGVGPTLYMPGKCLKCGVAVRFMFFRFSGNWLQKKGWYFE